VYHPLRVTSLKTVQMSLIGAVSGGGDGKSGGTFTPASNPVSVGGTFGNPGAAGFPTPGAAPILSARNNSGTNIRIPYARYKNAHRTVHPPSPRLA